MEENNIYEAFGLRLARLRQERGLSQRALAEALSVTRQAVSSWERGQTAPDMGTLERICRILEVDWNCLCGGKEPARRRAGRGVFRAAGALVLALALILAALILPPAGKEDSGRDPGRESARTSGTLRGEVLRSHQLTAKAVGPHGLQKKAAGDLAEALEALGPAPGPVELSPALREGFALFGEACQLRFLPAYDSGRFADRNGALTWLYLGLSWKGAPDREQVDGWLDAWFDPSCQWEHGSTEDFTLTEAGVYRPESAYGGSGVYRLESLERREDGGLSARLLVQEATGAGEALPDRLLTLELTAAGGQITFSSAAWEEAL